MTEKTKNIIVEVIRWIAFVPVVFICIVIGFNIGVRLVECFRFPYVVDRVIILATVLGCVIPGARFLIPKHKKLATILAVMITVLLATWYLCVEIYIFTHGK